MSLSNIRMRDIYFTADGRVLLSIDGDLFSLERIVAPENADFLSSILKVQTKDLTFAARAIITDSQEIYDLARKKNEAAGEIHHDETVYHFSRLLPHEDSALFHLRRLESEVPNLETLGLSRNLIWHIEQTCQKAGLVVAVGLENARRSARLSSLLYSLLHARGKLAWTLESAPAYRLAGLYHHDHDDGYCVQAHVAQPLWGETIRAASAADADYILIDEIKEAECAAQALTAASSGHLVLSGFYAETIPEALSRLADYAASVLSETLARKLIAQSFLLAFDDEGALFADLEVKNKIAAGKWIMLTSDIESQMERLRHGQPPFA